MRKIPIFFFMAAVFSCAEDRPGIRATFEMLLNGEPWQISRYQGVKRFGVSHRSFGSAVPCTSYYELWASMIRPHDKFNPESDEVASLNFVKIPLAPGKYKVIPFTFECDEAIPEVYASFSTRYGDVSGERYEVLESEDNFLVIDSYEEQSREISGSFQVTFVIQPDARLTHWYPDTLRFTGGTFYSRIADDH